MIIENTNTNIVNLQTLSKTEKIQKNENEEVAPANSDLLTYHQKSAYYIDDLGIDLSKYKRSDEEIEKQSKIDKDVYEVVSKYYATKPETKEIIKDFGPLHVYSGDTRGVLDIFEFKNYIENPEDVEQYKQSFNIFDQLEKELKHLIDSFKRMEFELNMFEKYAGVIKSLGLSFNVNPSSNDKNSTIEKLIDLNILDEKEVKRYGQLKAKEIGSLEDRDKFFDTHKNIPSDGFVHNFKYYKNIEELENERKDSIKNLYGLKKDLDDETYEKIVEKYNEKMKEKRDEAIKNGIYSPSLDYYKEGMNFLKYDEEFLEKVLYKDESDILGAAAIRDDIIHKGYSKNDWIDYFQRQNTMMEKAIDAYSKYDITTYNGAVTKDDKFKIYIDYNNKIIDELKDRWGYGDLDLSA